MEKIALVTGASRGIGRATARRLAHDGYAVAVNYRVRKDCADSLVEELTGEGLCARAFCHEIDHLDGTLFTDNAVRMLSPEEIEEIE